MGFEFSAEVVEDLTRVAPQIGPYDDDLVSTMRSLDATAKKTKTNRMAINTSSQSEVTEEASKPSLSTNNDNSMSVLSAGTSVTLESFQALENWFTGLQSQLIAEKKQISQQFDQIMAALNNITQLSKNDQSSNHNTVNARDESNASSKKGS